MTNGANNVSEFLIFGGTSEGRELVEWLSARGAAHVVASSATDYGAELVSGLPRVMALTGPLSDGEKDVLVASHDFACVIDATHPYATHVSESVAALASRHGLPLMRVVRDDGNVDGAFTLVKDIDEATREVAGRAGNILLTTGAKDLAAFTAAVPDFADRLFARVLPVADSVAHARELGLPASHVIAMQGPFSVEFNVALMRELAIDVMVTKASGTAGGFAEKVTAAERCGVEVVVIGRPRDEEGLSLQGVKDELEARYGA